MKRKAPASATWLTDHLQLSSSQRPEPEGSPARPEAQAAEPERLVTKSSDGIDGVGLRWCGPAHSRHG